MNTYQVVLQGGRVVEISDSDPLEACRRAADLHGTPAVAWRTPPVTLVPGFDPRRDVIAQ